MASIGGKDARPEEILNAWIDEVKASPSAEVETFLDKYSLSAAEKDEIIGLLANASRLKGFYGSIKMPVSLKEELSNFLKEKYRNLFKESSPESSKKDQGLFAKFAPQHSIQFSFRKTGKEISDKDERLIDDFIREIGGNKDVSK